MSSSPIQLDRSIRMALDALRRRIRGYVWIQGLAMLVVFTGILFWVSLAVDWFFEPSAAVRKFLLGAVVLGFLAAVHRWVGRRAFVPLRDRSMAILLERRFSEFDGALLTAVELTQRSRAPNDCNRDLLDATCRTAREPLRRLRLGNVFNPRPLRLALVAALLVAASGVSLAIASPGAFSIWWRRTVLMSNELWPRRTILAVEGFADGVARVARGTDFTLVAKADLTGQHVPRSVRVDYRPEGSGWLEATMVREGRARPDRDRYQEYSYTFRGVLSPIELQLRGGDASIQNLRIEVVDAPTLVEVEAECRYPAYMDRAPRALPATGVLPIPRGTKVILRAESNKRLALAEIDNGDTTQLVADEAIRRLHDIAAEQSRLARAHRSSNGTAAIEESQAALAARLGRLSDELESRFSDDSIGEAIRTLLDELNDVRTEMARIPSGGASFHRATPDTLARRLQTLLESLGRLMSFPRFNYVLQAMGETQTLDFVLHDVDGIRSTQPIRLTLSVVEDQPPQPAVRLVGIGSAVTPQARLPFEGKVDDDNGVDRVWLEYAVEGREPRREVLRQLEKAATEVPIETAFEVDSLRLEPGQKLLATIKARDRYNLAPEPNVGSGDRWMLDVVTPERLRAILESREIVLRQRFETIVEDIERTRDTLAGLTFGEESTADDAHGAESDESGKSAREKTAERRRAVRLLRIQRARQNGQKDSHEIAGVAEGFADIRRELLNNRIYTEELRIRIEDDIVAPLKGLVAADFVQLDETLAELETTHDDPTASPELRDTALAQTDRILKIMQEVLSRMVELEDFNEAVELLRSIIEEQQELREAVRERRKSKLRQLLED